MSKTSQNTPNSGTDSSSNENSTLKADNNFDDLNAPTEDIHTKRASDTQTPPDSSVVSDAKEPIVDEPNLDITLIHFRQWITLALIALVIIATCGGVLYFFNDQETRTPNQTGDVDKFNFSTLRYPHAKEAWLAKAQQSVSTLQKDFSSIKEQLTDLQSRQAEIELLEQKRAVEKQENADSPHRAMTDKQQAFRQEALSDKSEQTYFAKQSLTLAPQVVNKTQAPFIPAGSFAKAVLLGGVDAPANTLSQTNPEPLLLRFIEEGHLPNDTQSNLKGCVATAAVVGDISSERGHIRLERLSCNNSNQSIELAVEGTVFGSDGKNGVRGEPAWREGKRLQRAAMAGFLSGVTGQLQNLAPSTAEPSNLNSKAMLSQGLTQGATHALDKLSEYHIKRAENYHPIIQIDAGKTVDVVFLKGFFLTNPNKESSP